MAEMVEAHLLNVQREIKNLNDRKTQIDQEIARLEEYLQEGAATLEEGKAAEVSEAAPRTLEK